MEFRELECFLAVARLKGFSAAGKYLFISQSAVSQRVAALEKSLGVELFNRSGSKAELTKAGAYLYPRLEGLKQSYLSYAEHARDIAESGDAAIVLGYDGLLAEPWIESALSRAMADPRYKGGIRLKRDSISALTERLLDGTVDVAITLDLEMEPLVGFEFAAFRKGGACIYVSMKHRLAGKGPIRVDELEGENVLGSYAYPTQGSLSNVGELIRGLGFSEKSLLSCPDGETAFLETSLNQGVFVASRLCDEYARRFDVVPVDLQTDLPEIRLGLAYRKPSEQVEILSSSIRAAMRETPRAV